LSDSSYILYMCCCFAEATVSKISEVRLWTGFFCKHQDIVHVAFHFPQLKSQRCNSPGELILWSFSLPASKFLVSDGSSSSASLAIMNKTVNAPRSCFQCREEVAWGSCYRETFLATNSNQTKEHRGNETLEESPHWPKRPVLRTSFSQ
jgi:hypothetical protein